MNLFEPRTFSTDWEIMVVDRLNRCLPEEKIIGFAGMLEQELGLPVHIDWDSMEFALGINYSWSQFIDRLVLATDRAAQILGEHDLDLFPTASHPVKPIFNGSHIHIGSIHDETECIKLENRTMKYMPVFGAISANSPVCKGALTGFKSFRIRSLAHYCSFPNTPRVPETSQPAWGSDIVPKLYGSPTMEVRILDCTSSRRLLAELALFTAAFIHHQGTVDEESGPMGPDNYRDLITNRWIAARDGLQATMFWNGGTKPVAEIACEMLDECEGALEALGARRTDLSLLENMIRKRICQADFVIDLISRYPDPHCFNSVYAKLIRNWEVLDEYIEEAPKLDPIKLPDQDAIVAEHLANVGEMTHSYSMWDAMFYPPTVTSEVIRQLEKRGMIARRISPERGEMLYRKG